MLVEPERSSNFLNQLGLNHPGNESRVINPGNNQVHFVYQDASNDAA
jgi:hypothetical protein